MPPAEKHILEIDSAELAFGGRSILSGVYLLAETGCVTAVLGRNGCGKSCLMKILSGALKAGFCSMRIDGKWHGRFTEKEVRYLPQHAFIPGWLRLERVLRDFGLSREELERWFPLFVPLRGSRIGELSGGEQRILECFVILRSRTQFVLLDEPFSQIAPLHVETLQTLIRQEKMAKGILLTDHMYRHVTGIADRLYVMADGQAYPCANDEELVRRGYLRRM
ncbi:ATP-binding cassette domain-containing protein [Alistipes sp.]|jgi:ABC-type branched-subunit amino acid transport system ATPase component|uniref:ATP-binding cassette domain-containing protein n=1 Tax=Alistipes sp. TaxID=1872444 RepID=UPI001D9E2809|nr:ATP-binding cassette domain-containing protein [uncultured Alistipes sp.]MBD9136417.1 ATP-binding cassette domain-containing protein [Alistipes shahii]